MVNKAIETVAEYRYPAQRSALKCNFAQLEDVFDDCMDEAVNSLSADGINDYLEGASLVCMIGRGFEPVLVYLEEVPQICRHVGEQAASLISQSVWKISRTPNGVSILSFLQALPSAARRLQSEQQFDQFIKIVFDFMEATTGSIHGFHTTIPSPALNDLLDNTAVLLGQITLEGLNNWVDYGVRYYSNHPEQQREYFSLQSADSRAILQRERHGTLFADCPTPPALPLTTAARNNLSLILIRWACGFPMCWMIAKPVFQALMLTVQPWRICLRIGVGAAKSSSTTTARFNASVSSAWKTAASIHWQADATQGFTHCSWPCTPDPLKTPVTRRPSPVSATVLQCSPMPV
jgi:hypothetical protein